MNDFDIEKIDAEFENLIKNCDELSTKMLNEKRKVEYIALRTMYTRMSEIRYKIYLAKGFLNIWSRVENTDHESDFKRLANYCFNDLLVNLNLDIIYAETHSGDILHFLDLFSCWRKLCRLYQSYYALKFDYARNNEI